MDQAAQWGCIKNWQDPKYLGEHFGPNLMLSMEIVSEKRDPLAKQYGYDRFLFDIDDAKRTDKRMNMENFIAEY